MIQENTTLQDALKKYFGFDGFKGNQEAVVNSILAGEDCFVIASRLAERIGGQVHFLKPLGRYGTGQLPNDPSKYGAYAYHAFVLKGSKYFDEFFENGIEFADWLSQYKQLNNFSDEMMELPMKIDAIAPPGVWK